MSPFRCQKPARGFILPLVVVLIFIVAILAFSYHMRSREEAWRVHRLYFGDLLTKSAEGVAEAAFAWFLANPGNDLARTIRGQATINSLSLLGELPVEAELNKIGVVLRNCRISLVCDAPFFNAGSGPNGFPSGFSTADGGYLFPDDRERYGLLRVEIEVYTLYKQFSRKYEVLREVRSFSLLPSIFGQFTLFVKNKRPLAEGDPNHLKMKLGPVSKSEFAGFADEAKPLGNPMVLIHDIQERNQVKSRSARSPDITVSLPWTGAIDLKRRGWVFLGAMDNAIPANTVDNAPFRSWQLNVFDGNPISNNAHVLPAYRFFGQLFLLPTFKSLLFHTAMPDFISRGIPPDPAVFSTLPFSSDPLGIPFRGAFFVIQRDSFYSANNGNPAEYNSPNQFLYNYYDSTRNHLHKGESQDGPLLYLFGDMYPQPGLERSQLVDQRSPTLVWGNVMFRFKQLTRLTQMGEQRYQWVSTNDMADFFQRNELLPASQKPSGHAVPYFPFRGAVLDPRLPIPQAEYQNESAWRTFSERTASNREFAAVTYSLLDIVGSALNYKSLMSKTITALPAQVLENILQNNMESETNPAGWLPKPKNLLQIPDIIVPLDEAGNEAPVTPRQFFFTSNGPAYQGSGVLLRDETGVHLAGGNLSNLWPFADSTVLSDGQFTCTGYDLRQKTTHLVTSPADFYGRFIKEEKGQQLLDLKGAIVTVLGGDLVLKAKTTRMAANDLVYRDGGMLIVHEGDLIIQSNLVREDAAAQGIPLTLATAKTGKHIRLVSGLRLDAFLISSGTLMREAGAKVGFDITGGVAVKYLDFSERPESVFYGHPGSQSERFRVTWHPDFNVFDPANRNRAHRLFLGPQKSYWKSEPL